MISTKAAILENVNKPLRIMELKASELRSHDVLLKVISVGICHSDYHLMVGDSSSFMPIILGHEILAKVEAVGDHVSHVTVGDIVIPGIIPPCGHCSYCRTGHSALCDTLKVSVVAGPQPDGLFRWFLDGRPVGQYCFLGGFSQYVITNELQLFRMPQCFETIPEACVLGCAVTSGAGAVFNLKNFTPGMSVAVIGVGGIGGSVIMAARTAGASRIIAVDLLESRRNYGLIIGANDTISSGDAAAIKGQFDIVFECVGSPTALDTALSLTKKCGICIAIGMPGFDEKCAINLWDLVTQQKTLQGSVHGSGDFAVTMRNIISLWQVGQFNFEKLISHKYSLENINHGFHDMLKGENLRGIVVM